LSIALLLWGRYLVLAVLAGTIAAIGWATVKGRE
jgi:hypothetical protein